MRNTVADIELGTFEHLIMTALGEYEELAEGAVTFHPVHAAQLALTPDKPNTARSVTPVWHWGKEAGKLVVIAFEPGDGSGDELTHQLTDLDTGSYPHASKIVPRGKAGIHSEAHLTIASVYEDNFAVYAGNLTELGLSVGRDTVIKLGELGQSGPEFHRVMANQAAANPTATLTTGYRRALRSEAGGERFGDPHAVYNAHPEIVQVCGFIALSTQAAPQHLGILQSLGAVELRR